jgi:hypothetical protein
VVVECRVDPVAEVEGLANGDAILPVVDTAAVGKDVNVGTLGAELAIALDKIVLADGDGNE